VTTRHPTKLGHPAEPLPAMWIHRAAACAAAGPAPPPRASFVPLAAPAAGVAASSPANAAPISRSLDLRSTAGSTAGLDTSTRTPCADTSAIPAADLWRACLPRWYPAYVPWEVTTPWGRPGRMAFILLGHSPISGFSPLRLLPGDGPPTSQDGRQRQHRRRHREGNREGHVPEMLWG